MTTERAAPVFRLIAWDVLAEIRIQFGDQLANVSRAGCLSCPATSRVADALSKAAAIEVLDQAIPVGERGNVRLTAQGQAILQAIAMGKSVTVPDGENWVTKKLRAATDTTSVVAVPRVRSAGTPTAAVPPTSTSADAAARARIDRDTPRESTRGAGPRASKMPVIEQTSLF